MDRPNSLTFGNSTEKKAAKERRLKTLEDGVAKLSKDLAFLMGEHTTLLGKHGTLLERVAKLEVASAKNVTEHEVMKKETARVDASLWETKHAFHDAVYGGRYGKTEPEWVLLDQEIDVDIRHLYRRFHDMDAQIHKLMTQQINATVDSDDSDSSSNASVQRDGEHDYDFIDRITRKREYQKYKDNKRSVMNYPKDDASSSSDSQ